MEVRMAAIIIDGKKIATRMKDLAKRKLEAISQNGFKPRIAVVIVGEDPASQIYVKQKEKACAEVGLESEIIKLPVDCTQSELQSVLIRASKNVLTAGVMLQLPLPKHLDANKALRFIRSEKDVDGFTFNAWGDQEPIYYPCTPAGIIFALDDAGIDVKGRHVVIVGRSNTVGKPLAAMMFKKDATVTICHSKTENLADITKQADILVAAVGKPKLITVDMVKEGAVVVDVGINRIQVNDKTRLVGDVDFDEVSQVASYITPVPGGVGPLTVAQLMLNTCAAAEQQINTLGLYNLRY